MGDWYGDPHAEAVVARDLTVGVLRDARELLARGSWTQGALARDADGDECDPTDPGAICFCAIGAVRAKAIPGIDGRVVDALFETIDVAPLDALNVEERVADFNDAAGRTLPEVLAWFDRAIEHAAEAA